jgi:hypothetical protein
VATSSSGAARVPEEKGHPSAIFSIEDATYSVYDGPWLRLRAQARQVLVIPRALGPFEIGVLRELVVVGARFEVLEDAGCRESSPCADRFLADASLGVDSLVGGRESLGQTTAALFDVAWVVVGGGKVRSRFTAREGRIGYGGELVLYDFELEQAPVARRVRAGMATWNPATRAFWIAGDYALEDGPSRRSGRGLLIGATAPNKG